MNKLQVRIQYSKFNTIEFEYPTMAYAKRVLKYTNDERKAIAIRHAIKRENAIKRFINKSRSTLTADEFVKGIHSIVDKYGVIDYSYTDNE